MTLSNVMYVARSENGSVQAMTFRCIEQVCTEQTGCSRDDLYYQIFKAQWGDFSAI